MKKSLETADHSVIRLLRQQFSSRSVAHAKIKHRDRTQGDSSVWAYTACQSTRESVKMFPTIEGSVSWMPMCDVIASLVRLIACRNLWGSLVKQLTLSGKTHVCRKYLAALLRPKMQVEVNIHFSGLMKRAILHGDTVFKVLTNVKVNISCDHLYSSAQAEPS